MPLSYRIEIDGVAGGPYMGHLLDQIGCIWLAPTPEAALEQAPAAIASFHDWLQRHGEPDVARVIPDQVQVETGQIQEITAFGQSGSAVGLFPWDLEPASEEDILTAVRRLGYARRDLLELVTPLPAEALDWQPPGSRRSIRKNLTHIRNAQGFYLTRLFGWERAAEILPSPWPEENLFTSLSWVTGRVTDAFLSLPMEMRSSTFQAEEPTESWTARKMLRRIVEHEREHLEVMRRTIRAWGGEPVDPRPWVT